METVQNTINKVFETNDIKYEENINRYYDLIDLNQEYELIKNVNFIRSQISFIESKIYIAGDPVDIRLSKKGSIYFTVKGNLVRGLIRNILLEKLIEFKYSMSKEPVGELPQYVIYIASNDKYKLLVYINKKNSLYTMVYDYEQGLLVLKEQKTKSNDRKLKEEPDTHQSGSKVWLKDPDEVYGSLAPEMFNRLQHLFRTPRFFKYDLTTSPNSITVTPLLRRMPS